MDKKPWIAVGLGALTFIGGHFVNRRWDRAVLFFTLVIFLTIVMSYAMTYAAMGHMGASGDVTAYLSKVQIYWRVAIGGVGLLWVVSLILTYLDARKATPGEAYRWTLSGLIGAVMLTILATGVFVYALLVGIALSPLMGKQGSMDKPTGFARETTVQPFYSSVYFGGGGSGMGKQSPPPKGKGYLQGRIIYAGKSASEVTLTLSLNGKYRTDHLVTDKNGHFTVRMAPGTWHLNNIQATGWKDKPEDGKYLLVSGHEPKLRNGHYKKFAMITDKGLPVIVSTNPPTIPITFIIRPQVKILWPPAEKNKVVAQVTRDSIAWAPYPEATQYFLSVTKLRKEGRSTFFEPVLGRRLTTTSLPLTSIGTIPDKDKKNEYRAAVIAFDAEGKFLSDAHWFGGSKTFVLEGKQLVTEDLRRYTPDSKSIKQLKAAARNKRRADTVIVLIKEGMYPAAQQLLGRTKKEGLRPGHRQALAGYLEAAQGRCDVAQRLFDKAKQEGGSSCVPRSYYGKCTRASK